MNIEHYHELALTNILRTALVKRGRLIEPCGKSASMLESL